MTNRFTKLLKDAYQFPRHKRDMTEQQRNLYQATKHAYTKGTPTQRANLRTNARAMVAQHSTT